MKGRWHNMTVEGPFSEIGFDTAFPLTCPSGSSCTAVGYMNAGLSWACCDEIHGQGNTSVA